jgi:hypothetical protein
VNIKSALAVTISLLGASQLLAQPVPQPSLPGSLNLHQIYLDEPVQKIEKLEYRDTGEPLQYELDPDGTRIYIRDYDGTSPVAVWVVKVDGSQQSFYRSRCQIDEYVPEI